MNNNEELYQKLHDFRKTLLSEIEKWPLNIRREAALFVLKTLTIEMEHLPSIARLYKLESVK